MKLPPLYAILDEESLQAAQLDLYSAASALRDSGIRLVQYRAKRSNRAQILQAADLLSSVFSESGAMLILNDHPDLAKEAGWHGVHVGQTDGTVGAARNILGETAFIGVSTHTLEQFSASTTSTADYVAFGPIFGTRSKVDAQPTVGLEGLRAARQLSDSALVAIGGISSEQLGAVFSAGADSIALISAFFHPARSFAENARQLRAAVDLASSSS